MTLCERCTHALAANTPAQQAVNEENNDILHKSAEHTHIHSTNASTTHYMRALARAMA